MSPKLVIFDLDNTLVITRPAAKVGYKQAINLIAKSHGIYHKRFKLYNHWKKIVQRLLGEQKPQKRRFEYSLRSLLTAHKIPDTYLPQSLRKYEKELLENLKPQFGAKELLKWLKQNQVVVIVSTGSERSEAIKKLKSAGLYRLVDHLITSNETNTMKPHPLFVQMCLELVKAKPNDVVVVGDNQKEDLDPAIKLHLKTVLIPTQNIHLSSLKPQLESMLQL